MPALPHILILSTGGNITASTGEDGSLKPTPFTRERLLAVAPDIGATYNIDIEAPMTKDSANFAPADWRKLGDRIHQAIRSGYDGVVVMHGLDTMPYTATALSLMLRSLPIPVVLVGATTPPEFITSDAKPNLLDAIRVAAQVDIAEVVVVSDGKIFRGNRVKKLRELDPRTFDFPDTTALGEVNNTAVTLLSPHRPRGAEGKFEYFPNLEPDVVSFMAHPGFQPARIERSLSLDPRGILFIGYGSGCFQVEGEQSILPMLKKLRSKGIPAVVATQVPFGGCHLDIHEVGCRLLAAGALSAHDMTYEAALVKLMWALGQTKNYRKVIQMMKNNYAGEISPPIMEGAEDYFSKNTHINPA